MGLLIFFNVNRKRIGALAAVLATALVLLCSCTSSEPRTQILKVYNWADYIDEDVRANFPKWYEQQTGEKVRVIYQTFDINEIMLTKIERGHEDYDVVCPSEYIIERMLRKDLLLPIDTAFGRTPNFIKNVSPYITRQIDATSSNGRVAHRYAVGYMWGTCGILYNKKHVPHADAQTWGTLWNRKYRGKLLMKDSYRDSYGTALIWAHRHDLAAGKMTVPQLMNDYSPQAIKFRSYVIFKKLRVLPASHAAYYTVTRDEMRRFQFVRGDLEGVVNIPQKIKKLKLSISLREDTEKDRVIRVSLRSGNGFHCRKMAEEFFHGGGHEDAAGGRLECSIEEAEQVVLRAIMAYKEQLR